MIISFFLMFHFCWKYIIFLFGRIKVNLSETDLPLLNLNFINHRNLCLINNLNQYIKYLTTID